MSDKANVFMGQKFRNRWLW